MNGQEKKIQAALDAVNTAMAEAEARNNAVHKTNTKIDCEADPAFKDKPPCVERNKARTEALEARKVLYKFDADKLDKGSFSADLTTAFGKLQAAERAFSLATTELDRKTKLAALKAEQASMEVTKLALEGKISEKIAAIDKLVIAISRYQKS